jgi:hypothetical protein
MVVLSNRRLGPSVELLLSSEVAATILRETAEAARTVAADRWEHELVRWLDRSAGESLDVGDIAWSPEHFDHQRCFLVDAIERALATSAHPQILRRWGVMIAAHPRDSVQFGRRWRRSQDHITT